MRPIRLPVHPGGHAAPITHVARSRDGRVATSGYDGVVLIWDPAVATPVGRIEHLRLVNSSSWSADGRRLATASADKTVALWTIADDGTPVFERALARHTDDVNAVAWTPDDRHLIAVSEDHTVSLWDTSTGAFVRTVANHSGHCMGVDVSVDGAVATVGEDGAVILVSAVDDDASVRRVELGVSIEGCAWSPDGEALALACDDGVLRLLDRSLGGRFEMAVADSAIRSVAWYGDDHVVLGSYDGSVRVVDLTNRSVVARCDLGRLWPRSLCVGADEVLVGSFGATPARYALPALEPVADGGPATPGVNALSVNNGEIVAGLDSGELLIIDADRRLRTTIEIGMQPILAVARSDDLVVCGTYGGDVVTLTVDGEELHRLSGPAPITSTALSPDGRHLAVGNYDGELVVYELAEGRPELHWTTDVHGGSIKSIAWSSDDELITGATDCIVRRVRPSTGTIEAVHVHGNLVNSVAATADVTVSGSRDRTVALHAPGRSAVLLGSDESVKSVAVLVDGTTAAVFAGSYDFALYRWSVDLDAAAGGPLSGEIIHEFDQAVSCMTVDRAAGNGIGNVVAAGWDGTLVEITAAGTVLPLLDVHELRRAVLA